MFKYFIGMKKGRRIDSISAIILVGSLVRSYLEFMDWKDFMFLVNNSYTRTPNPLQTFL